MKQLVVPKTVHKGRYGNINRGFSDIADEKNRPTPEKTLLHVGSMSGRAADNNLYCISDGKANELVVTIYNQMAKTGCVVYISEGVLDPSDKIRQFLDAQPAPPPPRIFVTFTGGDTFSISPLGRKVQEMLKAYTIHKLTWNTWSYFPHSPLFCSTKCYIVKLDLSNGNVASFATSLNQVERYLGREGFLDFNRKSSAENAKIGLKKWFGLHPEYAEFEKRVMAFAKRDPAEYSFYFMTLSPTTKVTRPDSVSLFLSYRKGVGRNIEQQLADPDTELVILKPGIAVELPRGEPVGRPPPLYQPFEVNTSSSEGGVRRRKKKTDKSVEEKPTIELSDVDKTHYTVVESPTFKQQVAVLDAFPSAEANQHKERVKKIKEDLKAGRLPSKSVGKFYIIDFPLLSGNRGRGQWRLLIARQGNELTLHAIADYHGRQTGDWVIWGG